MRHVPQITAAMSSFFFFSFFRFLALGERTEPFSSKLVRQREGGAIVGFSFVVRPFRWGKRESNSSRTVIYS